MSEARMARLPTMPCKMGLGWRWPGRYTLIP